MSSIDVENVCKYLKSKDIHILPSNKWLLDCINWYKSHSELRDIYNSLEDYVCIQWLLSDLKDVQQSCLPASCKDGISHLPGRYCVQINWVRDISQPCYTQLQAIQNINVAESNEYVSAEESKKQNWEPNPKRVLMMEVTDGCTVLKAMEYSSIPKLNEPFLPGFKAILIGPVECRKGILFLRSNNINLLGGEVDYLNEIYAKETLLSRCLNIIPPIPSGRSGENTNRFIKNKAHPTITSGNSRSHELYNDIDQLPQSTSLVECEPQAEEPNIVESDDDDVFCQLPDSVLNGSVHFDSRPFQSSPVLDLNPIENKVENNTVTVPARCSKSQSIKKQKLFPSLEELRNQENEASFSSNIKSSTPKSSLEKNFPVEISLQSTCISTSSIKNSNTFCTKIDACLRNEPPVKKQNVSCESVSSLNNTVVENLPSQQEFDNSSYLRKEDFQQQNQTPDNSVEVSGKNMYPQFKRVKVKVDSITNLKIRNGEWHCCVVASFEDKTENVKFSNEVLKEVFSISAEEVEVWRGEMATNPSLKKKVNEILKTGQTKLKMLNCLMTVEYSSEDCIPTILSIHNI